MGIAISKGGNGNKNVGKKQFLVLSWADAQQLNTLAKQRIIPIKHSKHKSQRNNNRVDEVDSFVSNFFFLFIIRMEFFVIKGPDYGLLGY